MTNPRETLGGCLCGALRYAEGSPAIYRSSSRAGPEKRRDASRVL